MGLGTLNLNLPHPGRDTHTNTQSDAGLDRICRQFWILPLVRWNWNEAKNDVQIIAEAEYKGTISRSRWTDLNYPSQHFVILPSNYITGVWDSLAHLHCIPPKWLTFPFLCDVSDDSQADYFNGAHMESGGNFVEAVSGANNKGESRHHQESRKSSLKLERWKLMS